MIARIWIWVFKFRWRTCETHRQSIQQLSSLIIPKNSDSKRTAGVSKNCVFLALDGKWELQSAGKMTYAAALFNCASSLQVHYAAISVDVVSVLGRVHL